MKEQKSLFSNVIYNFLLTGMNFLFPLITSPYISRVLGADNLGKVNFATSITNWFVLLSIFGINVYGVREIAKVRYSKDELNKVFSELIFIKIIVSIISIISYIGIVSSIQKFQQEKVLYLVMSLNIIFSIFSIDWFYQGIEEYKYITVRSLILKVISLVSIILFVKNDENYVIYALISSIALGMSNILSYIYSFNFVRLNFSDINIKIHLRSLVIFFITGLVVNIYTQSDQTILGFMATNKEVAFANRTRTILGLAGSLSTAVTSVTMPRASYFYKNDHQRFKKFLEYIPNFMIWITVPLSIAIMLLSDNIMYILGGNEFLEATNLLMILSFVVFLSPLNNWLQNQVLVPSNKENIIIVICSLTALLSAILNIIFIPKFGVITIGIVSVVCEVVALCINLIIIRFILKYKNVNIFNKAFVKFVMSSIIMGSLIILIKLIIKNYSISFIVSSILGFTIYLATLILIKEETTLHIINKIKIKFSNKTKDDKIFKGGI